MDSTNKRAPVGRGASRGNDRSDGGNHITAATLHDALNRVCAEVGIVDRDVPADGQWHPTDINGDPRGRGDGRIKLFPDAAGCSAIIAGGCRSIGTSSPTGPMTAQERQSFRRRVAESKRQAEAEARERHDAAAEQAAAILEVATGDAAVHPYAIKKLVPFGPLARLVGCAADVWWRRARVVYRGDQC